MRLFTLLIIFNCGLTFSQNITRDSGSIISGSNLSFITGNHLPDSFLKSDKGIIKYENIEGSPYIDNGVGANKNLPLGRF